MKSDFHGVIPIQNTPAGNEQAQDMVSTFEKVIYKLSVQHGYDQRVLSA